MKLQEDSLDFALAHIKSRGDTDILPPAFEIGAIEADWPAVRKFLAGADLDTWAIRAARRCLSPKRELAFRIATQLDVYDTLVMTALLFEVGTDLEASRVPRDDLVVHSYRFEPTQAGQMFSTDFSFETFRHRSLDMAASQGGVVLVTDIADFFPRIYSHPLENAIDVALTSDDHARVLKKLLKNINQRVSHGRPVGASAFRLLADVALTSIDFALLSDGYQFCRYSDDYRIFVPDERNAREACAFLANLLLQPHGLTLQESKTEIIESDEFIRRFEKNERDAERHRLGEQFDGLWTDYKQKRLEEIEAERTAGRLTDWQYFMEILELDDYNLRSYDDLSPGQQEMIDGLNLWGMLQEERESGRRLDVPTAKFLLRRIADLGLVEPNGEITGDIGPYYPVFPEAIQAVAAQRGLTPERRVEVGAWLLSLLDHPVVGHLEYHRAWILDVFARSSEWNHSERLLAIYDEYPDPITRTGVVLALGSAGVDHWFRLRKQEVHNMGPWERRAFLYGARCLPTDEARHWYNALRSQLTDLDLVVANWAASKI
jgi:hypothetical protein